MIEETTATQPQAAAVETKVETTQAASAVDTGKGGPEKPYQAQLKKELQGHQALSRFGDFSEMAQAVVDFEAKKDRLVEIPAQDAPDDVKAAFTAKIRNISGVPDKPEGYEFDKPVIPQGLNVKYDESTDVVFKKLAHEIGLNTQQAKLLHKWDTDRQIAGISARQKAAEDARIIAKARDEEALSKWKTKNGKDYEANTAKAMDAMKKLADDELVAILSEARLPSGLELIKHPKIAEHFFNLDQVVGDTEFIRSGKASKPKPPAGVFNIPEEVRVTLPLGSRQ